jgi:hypothetical protein
MLQSMIEIYDSYVAYFEISTRVRWLNMCYTLHFRNSSTNVVDQEEQTEQLQTNIEVNTEF